MKKIIPLLFLALGLPALGQFNKASTELSLSSNLTEVAPGSSFKIAAQIKHEDTFWSYYNGSIGGEIPLTFAFETPEGITVSQAQFPKPKIKEKGNEGEKKLTFTFHETTTVLFDVSVPETYTESSIPLTATANGQLCNESGCLPPSSFTASFSIAVGEVNKSSNANFSAITKKAATLATDIALEVSSTDTEITYHFITSKDLSTVADLYFTDPQSLAAPISKQTFIPTDKGYTLTLKRRLDFLDETIGIPETVSGLLFSTSGDIFGATALLVTPEGIQTAQSAPTVASTTKATKKKSKKGFLHDTRSFTEEEKKAHAALYDAKQKVNYITLEQAKQLGSDQTLAQTSAGSEVDQTLITAMFFAFIGGMILNLMPCVFPVLGLKVMGFAQLAGNEPRKIKIHGLVFTLGVVVSMWILAGAILAVKSGLEKAGEGSIQWGAQMQNPIFVALIILLLFIMGLNMYGIFEIGTKLTGAGGELQSKKGYSGSFFSGILTTLIATPCSGPFLGAAMSYTLGLPALEAMMVFTVFALGISFPYLALAFIPALINKLPQPGAWMEVLKKFMAFPLFATAVFFLGTFGKLTGVDGMFWLSMAMVVFGLAAWAYGTWSAPYIKKSKRLVWGFGLPAITVAVASYFTYIAMQKEGEVTEGWHPGVVEHHVSKKRIVWVDYTADW